MHCGIRDKCIVGFVQQVYCTSGKLQWNFNQNTITSLKTFQKLQWNFKTQAFSQNFIQAWIYAFGWHHSWVKATVLHDDVMKWKHFPRYWPFVRGIHRSPVNSPHKSQWRWALMFSLICAWINGWLNNREAGDLRRHRAHYNVTVLYQELMRFQNPIKMGVTLEAGFHWSDYLVFGLMLLVSLGIGMYQAICGSKKTTHEYHLGSRAMGLVPVTMSLVVSYISTITLIGYPAEMFAFGVQYYWFTLGIFLGILLSTFVCVPLFYPLKLTSVNEVWLTYHRPAKMAAVSQSAFSSEFSWMKNLVFWFEFHWILFLTIIQHWFT